MSDESKKIPLEDAERIRKKLSELAPLNCPRCGHEEFGLAEVYAILLTSPSPVSVELGNGNACAVTICIRCGFVALHTLAVLGDSPTASPREGNSND